MGVIRRSHGCVLAAQLLRSVDAEIATKSIIFEGERSEDERLRMQVVVFVFVLMSKVNKETRTWIRTRSLPTCDETSK